MKQIMEALLSLDKNIRQKYNTEIYMKKHIISNYSKVLYNHICNFIVDIPP